MDVHRDLSYRCRTADTMMKEEDLPDKLEKLSFTEIFSKQNKELERMSYMGNLAIDAKPYGALLDSMKKRKEKVIYEQERAKWYAKRR